MHLKYEHKLLPFLKYTIIKCWKNIFKNVLAICQPKTEFWAKLNTFVQLTGSVKGLP